MSICQLCLQEKKLIKSHIIPNFLYRRAGMFDDNFVQTSTIENIEAGRPARRVPSGEYEFDILCADCDGRIIGGYENYAQGASFGDIARINPNAVITQRLDGSLAWQFHGLDYTRYKLFLLSILWRMSISSRPMFEEINLGKHSEILRQMIYYGNAGKFYQYPILSSHYFNDNSVPTNLIITPVQVNRDDYSRVIMILPGFVHLVAVSYKPNLDRQELAQLVITPDGSMVTPELAQGATLNMIMALRNVD